MMFEPVSAQTHFPVTETNVLDFWKREEIFEATLALRRGRDEYVFYDGPPFATGLPHYGHLLAGTIKDVVPRYQTMRGRFVDRVFGWDCHGLPVEYEMEKELGLSGKSELEAYGIGRFNEACRGIVLRYTAEWEKTVSRMGRWVDFRRGYRTMDLPYMESIWWVFRRLWDRGLIYEGHKILPYCPRCATPLSNFEANQGYAEVEDPAITVRFQSETEPDTWFLAWTTTPWTLPSNLALAVGPDIVYAKVRDGDVHYILAESLIGTVYRDKTPEIVARYSGRELADRTYLPIFPYFSEFSAKGAFRILVADYVSTEEGTGIVHTAPGFGEDDAAVCRQNGIPEVCPVDSECRFTDAVREYAGKYVKDTDSLIIRRLKEEGKLVHRSTIRHNYPHCWRDDSPLIYRAISTWFVQIEPLKASMLEANRQIRWVPEHLRDGRFGKWLENARDWAVSRNRYWGCPLPIWRNAESGEVLCIGSVAELESLSGHSVSDIHKHFVDQIEIPSQNGGPPLTRIPEVLDCWFESGAMPYAQMHYPFENKERFETHFPSDFIAEGLDQTRGWFYTLVVLGAALFDRPPFRNVVVNGLILAEDGQKMSKRKKNYPDPNYIIDTYGADSLRLFLLGSPVVRAEDLKFSEDGIREVMRSVLIPLWNSYSFFVTYARVDEWSPTDPASPPDAPSHPLDRWILSSLNQMIEEIRTSMDQYLLQKAANRFEKFIDDLTNWYIRRSRRRFWKSQDDADKQDAYRTLHWTLLTFAKTAAPFIPFLTEAIYRNLRTESMPKSVHLCDYPEPDTTRRNETLERQMEHAMTAVSLGRHLRTQHSLKVRQPLARAVVVSESADVRAMLEGTIDIIAEELNVKTVEIRSDESAWVERSAKANFKSLGARLGKRMKEAASLISQLDSGKIDEIRKNGSLILAFADGETFAIGESDIIINRIEKAGLASATTDALTVAIDTVVSPELEREGMAREFVSRIQNVRKEMALDVSDRIDICCVVPPRLGEGIKSHEPYIMSETLAHSIRYDFDRSSDERVVSVEINGLACQLCVVKRQP